MLTVLAALALPAPADAQRFTTGTVFGSVRDNLDVGVPNAIITLEMAGNTVRQLEANHTGAFTLQGLTPGHYSILAEQAGYQPLRITAIPVVAGQALTLTIVLERRPPPITHVEERAYEGAAGMATGDLLSRAELDAFDRRRDATNAVSASSWLVWDAQGRENFTLGANGLPPFWSRLSVDGIEENLIRHPGLPGEGATAPLFSRLAIGQGILQDFAVDPEWRAAPGASLGLLSAHGGPRTSLRAFADYGGLGAAAEDNPADSAAGSFRVGVALGGPLKGDTASYQLRFEYQQLRTPTADPFELGGRTLAEALETSAGQDVTPFTNSTVRTWKGFTGGGALQWRVGRASRLAVRLGLASWQEEAPLVGRSLVNGAGSLLEASDYSGAVEFATGGEEWLSETRIGIRGSSRDWTGAGMPETHILRYGAAIGGAGTLPGEFSQRVGEANQTITFPMGAHSVRLGGMAARKTVNFDWLINDQGRADFGSESLFEAGVGSWTIANSANEAEDLTITEFGLFAEDTWRASQSLTITAGARFEGQKLPTDAVTLNTDLARTFAIRNDVIPADMAGGIGPRASINWNPGGNDRTQVRLAGGLVPGQLDLASVAEVARYDGSVMVTRGTGEIGWPTPTANVGTPASAVTLFNPSARRPRSFVIDGGVTQSLGSGARLSVSVAYHHTDYMLRRDDINRLAEPSATDPAGRPIYGNLESWGEVVVATPGSNRRFPEFDHVFGLSSTGFTDHYRATVRFDRKVIEGISFSADYTYSQTEDNLPGQLSGDPADRLLPLGMVDGVEWAEGTGDLDIPHRLSLALQWRPTSGMPLEVGARFRMRSGLPYTAGFRDGVDANGDGSSANDPVAVASVAGLSGLLSEAGCSSSGAFAERNGCREDAVQALDLHAAIQLPVGGARRLMLVVDAFNVISNATGITDRAAVLVDPDGTITTDGQGRLVLPLVLNDNFGQLLARRNDPRLLRIGLRLEN